MDVQHKVSLKFQKADGTESKLKIENIKPNISKDTILKFSKKYSEVYEGQVLNEAKLVQTRNKNLLD